MSCGCGQSVNGSGGMGGDCLQLTSMHRYATAAQSIPAGAGYTPVAFPSAAAPGFETANNWDGTFTIWTPPQGIYIVGCGVDLVGASTLCEVAIVQAGVTIYEGPRYQALAGGTPGRRGIVVGVISTAGGVAYNFAVRHPSGLAQLTQPGVASVYCYATCAGFVCQSGDAS